MGDFRHEMKLGTNTRSVVHYQIPGNDVTVTLLAKRVTGPASAPSGALARQTQRAFAPGFLFRHTALKIRVVITNHWPI